MKLLRYTLLLLILITGLNQAQAQIRDDLWFEGVVFLENGEELEGKLSFYSDHKTGLLQINIGNKILAFDANQVMSFSFYDDKLGVNRRFYSLPYNRSGHNYDIMLFFEATVEGPHLSLLSKTVFKTETRTMNNYPYRYRGYYIPNWYNDPYMPRSVSVMVPYETLYLVTPQSSIEDYSDATPLNANRIRYRKADYDMLLSMMKDKRGAIEKYVSENKLDYRQKIDVVKIVQYYNQLKAGEENQASQK
jgi:hypothetical protein